MNALPRVQTADNGDRRRGKHHASRSSKTFARRTIGPIENNHNLDGLEPPPDKKIPFGLADRDDDTAGTHKDSIKGVVNRSHERHASQLGGKIAENRARQHCPERSASARRFLSAASHCASKRPIWLGDAADP
jgi:hypothetical protein